LWFFKNSTLFKKAGAEQLPVFLLHYRKMHQKKRFRSQVLNTCLQQALTFINFFPLWQFI